jgi:hypothetical protein
MKMRNSATNKIQVGPMDDPVHVFDIEDEKLCDDGDREYPPSTRQTYEIKADCSSLNFLHKKDPYYNIPGLKNEIHHTVWRCLNREEQVNQ